mgnify:CR=1 FL=1
MKKTANRFITAILILFVFVSPALATELIPVGEVIGLELRNDTVTVAAFDDLTTAARDAGLRIGDEICSIDGRTIENVEDVRRILKESDGSVDVSIIRDGKEKTVHLEPAISTDGPRLGVYLRQGITGIGTVTWYDPKTDKFGTLGHGVNDSAGNLLTMTAGRAYPASVVSIQKGKAGQPGQLKGALSGNHLLGNLSGNTSRGVFGTAPDAWEGQAIPTASYDDVTTGKATIRSTISDGTPRDYSVEIIKIYPRSRSDGRNFLLKVTDPNLLAATGGIVQGMSGSPIIQGGKLVGAVTHVLVNSPDTGYGIFIENMLDAAT